jgi:hypothetical protein
MSLQSHILRDDMWMDTQNLPNTLYIHFMIFVQTTHHGGSLRYGKGQKCHIK